MKFTACCAPNGSRNLDSIYPIYHITRKSKPAIAKTPQGGAGSSDRQRGKIFPFEPFFILIFNAKRFFILETGDSCRALFSRQKKVYKKEVDSAVFLRFFSLSMVGRKIKEPKEKAQVVPPIPAGTGN